MDKFRELTTFIAVAKHGGFKPAAHALNMSPPTATRLVNSLETRIGARLLTRNTRQVVLTEIGQEFLLESERILTELEEAEDVAAGAYETPRGTLRVTAPVTFGQMHIAPILRDYLNTYPAMSVVTHFVNRVVDLIDEEFDVALRIGNLPDSSLSAVRVGRIRRIMVAAPSYIAEHGAPKTLSDLSKHRIVQFLGARRLPEWQFICGGETKLVTVIPTFSVNTATTSIEAAIAGWGITRALSYQVSAALAEGLLVEVLQEWDDQELPIHLVYPGGRRATAKTRAFIDLAVERIRNCKSLYVERCRK